MSIIDLHSHSSFSSDGEFSPEHIVSLGYNEGIQVLSITDHNSVKGIKPALKTARSLGMTVIPGIEIDCVFQNLNLHILGYGIDIENKAYADIEKTSIERDRSYFSQLIIRLRELGFKVKQDEILNLSPTSIPSPEFVGEVLLLSNENKNDSRLAPYRKGGSRSDMPYFNFYRDFCTPGKPAYIETQFPDLSTILQVIHKTGGVSVLAHPGGSLLSPEETLISIMKMGVRGIEAFSSYHTPEVTQYYIKKAVGQGVFMTCGSDFHGKNKPTISLGDVECAEYEHQIRDNILQLTQ